MGKVVTFNGVTRHDLPVDRVLTAAQGQLSKVVIIGYDLDGNEYFASSCADGGEVLWLLERLKHALLTIGESE